MTKTHFISLSCAKTVPLYFSPYLLLVLKNLFKINTEPDIYMLQYVPEFKQQILKRT